MFSSLYVLVSFLSVLEMTCTQVWYIIGIVSSSPTDFQSEKIGLIRVKNYLPINNRVKTVFWSEMKGVAKIKRYCHFGMAKIRLFYSGAMALILPWLKDITNFVLKLICSLVIFKSLRGDLYSSMIHHWNRQLKPYWFPVRKNRVN